MHYATRLHCHWHGPQRSRAGGTCCAGRVVSMASQQIRAILPYYDYFWSDPAYQRPTSLPQIPRNPTHPALYTSPYHHSTHTTPAHPRTTLTQLSSAAVAQTLRIASLGSPARWPPHVPRIATRVAPACSHYRQPPPSHAAYIASVCHAGHRVLVCYSLSAYLHHTCLSYFTILSSAEHR